MAGTQFLTLGVLVLLLVTRTEDKTASYYSNIQPVQEEDTLVNYCKLVRAGYLYGEKSVDARRVLTADEVQEYNNFWKGVFDVGFYQAGISATEFTGTAHFAETNTDAFPPSTRYHKDNPNTYLLFHIAKEIGKIHSTGYASCPSCVDTSIQKINGLLLNTELHRQISQLWVGTGALRNIRSSGEIEEFWVFLRCLSVDDRINPTVQPFTINLKPYIKCPDTTVIACRDDIVPKVSVGWRHCEIGGKIDTVGPSLVFGIDNCPGAVYAIKYIARDQCNKSDSCRQYFKVKNDPPVYQCPGDTVVTCIEDFVIHHLNVTSSCNLKTKQTIIGPSLTKGHHNCPGAEYRFEFIVTDTCGRDIHCARKITIQNDPPVITCPPDQTIECKADIKPGKYDYASACKQRLTVTTKGPTLVLGKEDCPGAIYEMIYEGTDSCGRTARCIQRFTIDNTGPKITCPPNQEVLCLEDIATGPPADLMVSCSLGYDVRISDPLLIVGQNNCEGAVYSVTYTVTDDCGRTDQCEQLFTILNPGPSIICPPDRTIMCAKDIVPDTPRVSTACRLAYTIATSSADLISGADDCPGSVYEITYDVRDACGRVKSCRQKFTIANPEPEIVCPPEQEVSCLEDINIEFPIPVVSCDGAYRQSYSDPVLVSGIENCNGSRYGVTFEIQDDCGRIAKCTMYFRLKIPDPIVTCPSDITVACASQITAGVPGVQTFCDLNYTATHGAPVLFSGIHNCPGAVYHIIHTITDECGRTYECKQRFIIQNTYPQITCPPDRTVDCEQDVTPETVSTQEICGTSVATYAIDIESGVPDCPGAVYIIDYRLEDSCGRVTACQQRVTLRGKPLEIICPPDTTVRSMAEIQISNIPVTGGCHARYNMTYDGPRLVSGADGKPGAVYAITYIVTDDCGARQECVRHFTFIGIPDDGISVICDCWNQYKRVSLDLVENQNDRFNADLAALIKKYGCAKLKSWAQSGVVDLWNAWASSEILGNGTSVASEIAKRGNINIVMQNLDKVNKAIEVLEEAINGEPKKTLEIISEWGFTEGVTHLTGSGTPAAVFSAIKSLGEFAQYLNNEILILNIKTLANYADQDPSIFDPDYYLREYAKVREIRPGEGVTWSDIHNPFRIAIYEYAQHRMNNVSLPPLNEIWNNQANMNLLRTVTYTMLQEACQYWCYKLTLEQQLNQLIHEQSLLLRFKAILSAIQNYDCNGNDKPCTMANAELKQVNGVFVCDCIAGYKWDPGKIRCIPYTDCAAIANTVEVYQGDAYGCDCAQGYAWNAEHTACIPQKPDCNSYYANTEAAWDPATNQWLCNCIAGYEWNSTRTACNPAKPDCNAYYANTEAAWDAATNQWLCNCIAGYEWNSTRTACILAKPDCNSYYANTEAAWDPATNQWLCNCIAGYEWNSTRTACVPARPDCNSYYANSEAVWDAATNQWLCNCIAGYEWNSTRTACIPARPDCNSYYANSEAVWDAATSQYLCNCISGYVWNSTRTACVLAAPDCNAYYPNSIPVWDFATNQYQCNCPQGYVWNAARTQCIPYGAPDCSAFYPKSTPLWDPGTNQYLCYCLSGYEWNATRTECVPLGTGNRDDPQVNPQQQKTGECNVTYGSGANEPEQYTIDVHRVSGTLNFSFNTYSVKDRIHIYHGGVKVFDSGCVGTSGGQTLTLNGSSSIFRIVVDPLCDPSESDTQWNFTLGCPQ